MTVLPCAQQSVPSLRNIMMGPGHELSGAAASSLIGRQMVDEWAVEQSLSVKR